MTHEVLPGELTTFRAVGATGFGLGAAGGAVLWIARPEVLGSPWVAVMTTSLCLALAVAMAFVPWGGSAAAGCSCRRSSVWW
jgi:hypothetical protein